LSKFTIRQVEESDFASIKWLNDEFQHYTSALDKSQIRELNDLSAYHKLIEVQEDEDDSKSKKVEGFLLVMGPKSGFDSEYYKWFDSRYSDFLYVDRIVVDGDTHNEGLGRMLYEDLFEFAKAQGFSQICCEYNLVPSNKVSAKFHNAFGFSEVGELCNSNNTKVVTMQMAKV